EHTAGSGRRRAAVAARAARPPTPAAAVMGKRRWLGTLAPVSRSSQHSRALELLELLQREEAPAPGAPVRREASRVRIPKHGALPRSAALLERLYHGELVPRERKP